MQDLARPAPPGWLPAPREPADPWAPLRAGPALPRAVLEAMRLERLVVHVAGGVYLPTDAAGFGASRLAALRLLVPQGRVVGLLAAAWAHGVGAPADPVEVLVSRCGRGRVPGVREREVVTGPDDVVERDGVRLTGLTRTAADLARQLPAERALPVVAGLVAAGADPQEVLALLRGGRHPGSVRARALVSELRSPSAAR